MKNYAPKMKQYSMKLLFLLTLLIFNSEVWAQDGETSASPLTYGPKIGLTSSGFYKTFLSEGSHTGSIPGVAVGGFVSYNAMDFLSVSAELLFMQQGGTRVEMKESPVDNSIMASTANTRLHNLELPLLVKLGLPNLFPGFKPQLILGPSVGYNLAATQSQDITFNLGETYVTGSGSENVRSEFQSMQYGLHAGIGAEVPLESFLFLFDVRYRYGINPINNGVDPYNLLFDADDIRSNTFLFSIGIGF